VGQQVRDRLLHHPRRLHHLRQEHLAGAEQVPDDVHAVHQRTFDHVQRSRGLLARLLGTLYHALVDTAHQRVSQARAHIAFASPPRGSHVVPAPHRSPTTFMPSISGPSITSSGRAACWRASSVSSTTYWSIPCTSEWVRRARTSPSRQARSSTFFSPFLPL